MNFTLFGTLGGQCRIVLLPKVPSHTFISLGALQNLDKVPLKLDLDLSNPIKKL